MRGRMRIKALFLDTNAIIDRIAGTAFLHGATLITRNANHYPMEEIFILSLPRTKQ